MAGRYLVRTLAGDHIAGDEAEILEWLKQGHCGCGDFVFVEAEQTWKTVCDLGSVAPIFNSSPEAKLEKPVITVFKLGYGRTHQSGPFTLSTVLEMIARGELCAASWIFVEGDKEWRKVGNVKILREALPTAPQMPPSFELKPVAAAAPIQELDLSYEALQGGLGGPPSRQHMQSQSSTPPKMPGVAKAIAEAMPYNDTSEVTRQSQPSIVPMPPGMEIPAPISINALAAGNSVTKTAILTKTFIQQEHSPTSISEPPSFAPTSSGFVPAPSIITDRQPTLESGSYSLPKPLSLDAGTDGQQGKLEVSVKLDRTSKVEPPAPPGGKRFEYRQENSLESVPQEEQTKAFSKLGLAQMPTPAPDVPPPLPMKTSTKIPMPKVPPAVPPAPTSAKPPGQPEDLEDAITVEIPQEPIWMIKNENTEQVSGPYGFQQVIDMLQTHQITKDDKISKQGTNRFCKISQQYEFNVKFTSESVVEGGVERQKILIKRRHPRVAYLTEVHVVKVGRKSLGKCVNISAGGILIESSDLDVALGEKVQVEILPGAIERKIKVEALVIGKIPKKPPGFALRFLNLPVEDKEAIEFFVMGVLKKEKAMGM